MLLLPLRYASSIVSSSFPSRIIGASAGTSGRHVRKLSTQRVKPSIILSLMNNNSTIFQTAAAATTTTTIATPTTEKRYFSSNNNSNKNNNRGFNIFNQGQEEPESYLKQYSVDLTDLAKQNKLDPIIGRHEEIRRCLQILARRTKNNPIVIGEAGVGKTAIAEGLAQRIVSGEVPESMKNKQVLRLDVTAMLSGAMFRGQFEERLQNVIKEVQAQQGKIILFIDELHTVVGAGATGGGGGGGGQMDMSNILKPALARGELQLLGATTLDEYRILEKDAALARRFQSVYVKEPTIEDTLSILRGLKPHYELHHSGIRIHDEALVQAAILSDRYIPDRKQPDKSIDLIDEACSRLRLEQESKPEIIWELERTQVTKKMELSALEQEEDIPKSVQRKKILQQEVQKLQQQLDQLTQLWEEEKRELNRTKQLKEQLEEAKVQMIQARRKGDYARAGELLHSKIPQLEEQLQEQQQKQQEEEQPLKELEQDDDDVNKTTRTRTNQTDQTNQAKRKSQKKNKRKKLLSNAVTGDSIATIIARHTGIPVHRITGSESKKLLHMEDQLRQRVIGQDHALQTISNCIRLARTRLQAQHRTLGNFLFLGPTGVGKTELCKALAEFIFDDPTAMTRIDMSEYNEKHTISRLIGAPPGYVGYEEGGILTESIRRRPYQILLLDEFEKGHRDVWNLLLQLFDEGTITDSHGRKIDCQNVIVVMTSNIGSSNMSESAMGWEQQRQRQRQQQQQQQAMNDNDNDNSDNNGSEESSKRAIMDVVRRTFSPELYNRIDEIIIFNRLQRQHMDQITEIGIQDITHRLLEGQNMTLRVTDKAKTCLAEQGYDIRYGARPLKRVLTKQILHPLSRLVLEGSLVQGDIVHVCTRGEAEKRQRRQQQQQQQQQKHEQQHPTTQSFGWISSNHNSDDKNDVVIIRNRECLPDMENEDEDDEEILNPNAYVSDKSINK